MFVAFIVDTLGTTHVVSCEGETHEEALIWLNSDEVKFNSDGDLLVVLEKHIVSVVIKSYGE